MMNVCGFILPPDLAFGFNALTLHLWEEARKVKTASRIVMRGATGRPEAAA